jgi:hypothetical protein
MSEHVVELNTDWRPEPGSPMPVLVQTEQRATLVFDTRDSSIRVVVTFHGCLATQFGYPNDEALAGNPLHRLGLRPYGVFEVNDSSWIDRLSRQNQVAFPSGSMNGLRHFVITFHDSTFECLASGYERRQLDESAAADILGELRGDPAWGAPD